MTLRSISHLVSVCLMAGFIQSCGEKVPAQTQIHVQSITVSPTELTLQDQTKGTVTATVLPENATDKTVLWSSANTGVATVDNGIVTPVAPGTTDIIAKTADQGLVSKCKVTVTSSAPEGKAWPLRLMTFNILQGGKADGSTDTAGHEWDAVRKTPCLNMLKEINPDIILLQECRREQLKFLKANLAGYNYFSYAKDGVLASGYSDGDATNDASFKNGGQRNVILLRSSMFEMKEWGRFWLSENPSAPSKGFGTSGQKIKLWLKVRHLAGGFDFYLFNTHFIPQSYGNAVTPVVDVITPCAEVNVKQMKQILGDKTVSGKGNDPTIVFFAGDLNSSNTSARMASVNDYLYRAGDLAEKKDESKTFNGFRADRSTWTLIDHIYYKNAVPKVYKVVNEETYGTQFLSDHFPVYCDFEINR